jgi:hypothetical protein
MMKMVDSSWSIVIFCVTSDRVQGILIDMYRFVEHLVGVQSLHFIIRDRIDDGVVVSFRILLDRAMKDHVESIISQHLQHVIAENAFIINPEPDHPLHQYVAWSWKERMEKDGIKKCTDFYMFLNQFSRMIVELGEADCFSSHERVEMAHVVSGMLGCTEYGQ